MSTTRLQEVQICFGFEQADRYRDRQSGRGDVAPAEAQRPLANPKLNTENDADGVRQRPRVRDDHVQDLVGRRRHARKVSERGDGAWAMCFGLGKVVKSGADAELHLHLHAADSRRTATRRNCRTSPSSSRSARVLASSSTGRLSGCAVEALDQIIDWLRSWPRQQQDHRRVRRVAARSRRRPASRCRPRRWRSSCRPRR